MAMRQPSRQRARRTFGQQTVACDWNWPVSTGLDRQLAASSTSTKHLVGQDSGLSERRAYGRVDAVTERPPLMSRAIPLPLFLGACMAAGFACAADDVTLSATNLAGKAVDALVDGDTIRLHATLASMARRATEVVFRLDALQQPLARCSIARGGTACDTVDLRALGWYWDERGAARPSRVIRVETPDRPAASIQ